MDEKFLISGGIPRILGELMQGHAFKKAELAEIDFQRKTYVPKCTYTTPVSHCSDKKPSIGFTGFCIYKETIYIATRTEVLVLSSHDYSILKVINDPLFNDIHDVLIHDGFLYVAVTGMDAVFVFDLETHEKTIKNVLQKDPFHRFSKNLNLNKISSLKPNESHPNHIFCLNDEIWVTRLKQKDAISLKNPNKKITIEEGLPHDGFLRNKDLYFTTVNGYVVVFNAETLQKTKTIKLTGANPKSRSPLGWCRGIYVDEAFFYVGFTQLRTTKVTENLEWLKAMAEEKSLFEKPAPTRIEKYTLAGLYVDSFELPKNGVYTIFNIEKISN